MLIQTKHFKKLILKNQNYITYIKEWIPNVF